MKNEELVLRYGINPYQAPSKVYTKSGSLPFQVLNGAPGYINLLDALNSWQLVRELKQVLHLPAAASFKHVSPAGTALGLPLDDTLSKAYGVEDLELSPLACAYARARGADRVSSYGDWVALSDIVDVSTARLLYREVSDGVIAPGYEPEALALLQKKRNGKYVILQADSTYEPGEMEVREVFGVFFEQKRNTWLPSRETLQDIQTQQRILPESAQRDLLVSLVTLKYTQSNSICLTFDGQSIGIGAGQQSRIHCTRLAATKAAIWYLRQHPIISDFRWRKGVRRLEQVNAVDTYLRDDVTPIEMKQWSELFEEVPQKLTPSQKQEWLANLQGVALGSDGFIPFRDTIDCAAQYGVSYVVQPGESLRDEDVIEACNECGIVMSFSRTRLFHH